MQGDGVDKDLGRAVDYYRRAADIGVAQARTHTRTQRGEAGGKTGGGGWVGGTWLCLLADDDDDDDVMSC